MNIFLAIVKKESLHIIRDKRTMLIVFFMPIVQILLFGFALSMEVNHIKFSILNLSKDNTSKQISQTLINNPYFEFIQTYHDIKQMQDDFKNSKIDMTLIFDHNFAKNQIIQILIDASDPNRASIINAYIENILLEQLDVQNFNIRFLYNPSSKSQYVFIPGLIGMILMLICAMMTSISIVREKENQTMQMLLSAPIRPFIIIFAKMLPYFFISNISLFIIMLLSVFVLNIHIQGNLFILLCFCMLYIFLALSIGLFVSCITKTQASAMLICGMVFLIPIILLSGMIFPTESMPKILEFFTHLIPAKWFIIGIKKIMFMDVSLSFLLKELIILLSMSFIFLFASIKKFKDRIE
ncbi:TPA: ABC transporter permease [Campylobacter lari]|nr:ABC transporter permease [Campylobacter lari]